MSSKTGTTYSSKKKIKKAIEKDREKVHGKITYRLRKQLEEEGQREVMEYKRNVN
jgi:hypothetical protein